MMALQGRSGNLSRASPLFDRRCDMQSLRQADAEGATLGIQSPKVENRCGEMPNLRLKPLEKLDREA